MASSEWTLSMALGLTSEVIMEDFRPRMNRVLTLAEAALPSD